MIKLLPTKEQKHLNRAFDAVRWTYNQCIAALQKEKLSKLHKFIIEEATVDKLWLRETLNSIRDVHY